MNGRSLGTDTSVVVDGSIWCRSNIRQLGRCIQYTETWNLPLSINYLRGSFNPALDLPPFTSLVDGGAASYSTASAVSLSTTTHISSLHNKTAPAVKTFVTNDTPKERNI